MMSSSYPVDIVVPVWNQPDRTRDCLASLVATAPQARLILVNNGCDGVTEQLLGEFAERLDDQAILVASPMAVDLVTALNRGIALARAPVVVVVRNGLVLPAGWLEPLLHTLESDATAGGVIPRFSPPESATIDSGAVMEVDHGSFTTMVMRLELLQRLNGFDGRLAEPLWCLRDLARRFSKAGSRLLQEPTVVIKAPTEVPLGSPARRAERQAESRARYLSCWGEARSFALVTATTGLPAEVVPAVLPVVIQGARQGHLFFLFGNRQFCREVTARLAGERHGNIRLECLPLLGGTRFVVNRLAQLNREYPELVAIREGTASGPLPALTLAGLTNLIAETAQRYYSAGSQPAPGGD
ncbi:MAG TPA: glycosyltransferase [Geobacteraceae bacterium]